MPIDPLPEPGAATDSRAVFAAKQIAFQAGLPAFRTQANALEANVVAKDESATLAATTALSAAAIAQASAAYKGAWSAQAGALAMPASVSHGGFFYALNAALANVATAIPGVAPQWTQIVTTDSTLEVVSGTSATALNQQTLALANPATTEVLAPVGPAPGWMFWVAPCNALGTNIVRRNGSLIDSQADDIQLNDPKRSYCFLYVNSVIGWRPI